MLSINFIRKNPKLVKKGCQSKNLPAKLVDQLLSVDKQRKELIGKIEKLRTKAKKLKAGRLKNN